MLSAVKSWNDSAQSPACSRNASPWATDARAALRNRASPANTKGGSAASALSDCSRECASGHSGCWSAGKSRQLPGVHVALIQLAYRASMTERIGIFGGTFDPIHVGHLVAAVNARHALELDRVVM